jgi:phosphoribosylaminoimidazole-succinocarboxamide synthase
MSTPRERAQEQRRLKLEAVARQVAEGSLTIRQMTPEERARYPKPDRPRRGRPRP